MFHYYRANSSKNGETDPNRV